MIQTIAIIGATGNMGAALTRSLSKGHLRLILCANDPQKLAALAQDILNDGATAEIETLGCAMNASWEADIIILAVPYAAEKAVAARIKLVANQKIVISMANPLNESLDGLVTGPTTSAAEELQHLLPHSKVVKAFNTVLAADFVTPVIDGKKFDAFIAGQDMESLQTVSSLVKIAGFNPLIAGGLAMSRTLENMTVLLIQLSRKYQYNWLAGWKVLHQ